MGAQPGGLGWLQTQRLDHFARLKTDQRRPRLVARPRSGCRDCKARGSGSRRAGYLRRSANVGRGFDRPARHRLAHAALPNELGWCNAQGNVLGVYLHGLFEDAAAVQALFGAGRAQPVPTLDSVFDGLADYVHTHFQPDVLGCLDSLISHDLLEN